MPPILKILRIFFHNKALKMKPVALFRLLQITKTFFLTFILVFAFETSSSCLTNYFDDTDVIKINPAYKIKRYSNGKVIAYTSVDNGEKIEYNFTDFNGDILLSAIRKQKLNSVILILSRKYGLSEMECRRMVKHSLNVLEEWGIIMERDKLLVDKDF